MSKKKSKTQFPQILTAPSLEELQDKLNHLETPDGATITVGPYARSKADGAYYAHVNITNI